VKLLVTKNKKVLQTIELDPDIEFPQVFLLGRSPHCHICISDANLSREHGQFTLENKKLYYQEQGHGQRVQMNHGQSLAVGSANILFDNPPVVEIKNENQTPIEVVQSQPKVQENLEESVQAAEISPPKEETQPVELESINFSSNDSYESDHHEISSEMLEETFKLTENNQSNDVVSGFESFENKEFQMNDTPSDEGQPSSELVDADATKVIRDFVKYELTLSGPSIPFERYLIAKPQTIVGRNNKCDIILNDNEVSSQHAKFVLKNNILYIEDLKSVNGVSVNGQKVNSQKLVEGDVVTICSVTFLVKVQSEFIEAEKNILMPVDIGTDFDKTQEFSMGDFQDSPHVQSQNSEENKKSKSSIQDLMNKLPLGELKNNPKRLALYAVMAVFLFIMLFVDPEEEQSETEVVAKKENTKDAEKNTGSEQATTVDASQSSTPKVPEKSPEELNYLNSHYALAMSYLERGDYVSAISEIDLILKVDPAFKDVASLHGIAKDGLAKIEEQERKRIEEEERIARKKEIDELVSKIEEAMKEQNLNSAEVYISKVMEVDPENIKVSSLRLEIEAIKEDIRKRAEEDALKKELRKKMVDALSPGKSFFIQKEWYKAIIKLNDFLGAAGMDEDLVKEASSMLQESKKSLEESISSPLEAARQFKQAQDLKNAYEKYSEVLQFDPSHEESLIAAREIKEVLMNRARVVYRQALVSESISHFRKAKEKFQEVLLIAPSDSEYYKKAEDKLKKIYLE
jgi:pSer/pThr/pTyr-binding forkhead associated (FHA) protein/Tfp pilus assembly protein PilF